MPNRIIKESVRTSKTVGDLTDFEFRLWVYLITYVDDYGRGSADPEILKGFVFARRRGITEACISKTLTSLAIKGLISLYKVDGESYFCFPNWEKHQQIRAKRSKFPAPPPNNENFAQNESCYHMISDDSICPRNPIQSNPNPNRKEPSLRSGSCAEPKNFDSAPPVISLPLNDGSFYAVSREDVGKWAGLYPAVDIMQELRNMAGWLDGNPTRKKTKRGVRRFITHWLRKAQDENRESTGQRRKSGSRVQNPRYSSEDLQPTPERIDDNDRELREFLAGRKEGKP